MNSHELANPIAPANFSLRRLAGKLQILRRQANRDKREDLGFVANSGAAVDATVAVDVHALPQDDFITNHGKRTDAAARSNSSVWTNDGGGMDLH